MKKKIFSLLIIISLLGVVGCYSNTTNSNNNTKQISFDSIKLKQQYTDLFTHGFISSSEHIVKLSGELYNKAIIDEIPERDTFESRYKAYSKTKTSNNDEIDFRSCINSFSMNYTVLSANEFILKNSKTLMDSGMITKEEYDMDTKKAKLNKEKYLKEIKLDLDNITKYYQL